MNRTIEVQDHGGKEPLSLSEENGTIRLCLKSNSGIRTKRSILRGYTCFQKRFRREFHQLGDSTGILYIRNPFNNIAIWSKLKL